MRFFILSLLAIFAVMPNAAAITYMAPAEQLASADAVGCARVRLLEDCRSYGASEETLTALRTNLAACESRLNNGTTAIAMYGSLHQMLEPEQAVTTQSERLQLAEDVIAQAANPYCINQGNHNTCALSALEVRTYCRQPELAAELLRQIALTGAYATTGGIRIEIEKANVHPDQEAATRSYGGRSYASQLFQLAIANLFWQVNTKDPRGIACPKGSLHYVQRPINPAMAGDTGERLVICWPDGSIEPVLNDRGRPLTQPCLSAQDVQCISALLHAATQDSFVLVDHKIQTGAHCMRVRSLDDLKARLIHCKAKENFPVVVEIESAAWMPEDLHLNHFPGGWYTFESNHGSTSPHVAMPPSNGGLHVVCVTNYDAQAEMVSVDNFWGAHADHLGDKAVAVSKLYEAISQAR